MAERFFPRLVAEGYRKTSDPDTDYNCIAWAAGDNQQPWWPSEDDGVYWPLSDRTDALLSAFIAAYGTLGYSTCISPAAEPGVEKVAIYVGRDGKPTHAAILKPGEDWSSKLGQSEDIAHKTLQALEGLPEAWTIYGQATHFMSRPHRPTNGNAPQSDADKPQS